MYPSDVRMAIRFGEMFPANLFQDISKNLKDVILFRHGGRIPSNKLP
jgi:hypothetical protein